MSYERDPYASTRGIGAIAAADLANPSASRARRLQQAKATLARDRQLSRVTLGPRGGLPYSSLGAIREVALREPEGGGSGGGGTPPIIVKTVPTITTQPTPLPAKLVTMTTSGETPPIMRTLPVEIAQPVSWSAPIPMPPVLAPPKVTTQSGETPPIMRTLPVEIAQPVSWSPPEPYVAPSNIGAGIRTTTATPPIWSPPSTIPDLPPELDEGAQVTSDNNKRRWLIIGGLGIAAYLFLSNSRTT
jgi:hypothetical protein